MDIEKIISDVVSKLTGNQSLIDEFLKNPAAMLKSKFNVNLPEAQVNAVVTAVKAKLGIQDAKGLLAKLKSFFKK